MIVLSIAFAEWVKLGSLVDLAPLRVRLHEHRCADLAALRTPPRVHAVLHWLFRIPRGNPAYHGVIPAEQVSRPPRSWQRQGYGWRTNRSNPRIPFRNLYYCHLGYYCIPHLDQCWHVYAV